MRNLVIVLGDQLNDNSAVYDGFDRNKDAVWMAEVAEESTHVWSNKSRIALFLSAMRHYEQRITQRGFCVAYRRLEDRSNSHSLRGELLRSIEQYKPSTLVVVEPGDYRVREELRLAASQAGIPLDIRPDRHFLSTVDDFRAHAEGRVQLRMEYFYREMRRRHGVLMDGARPIGGEWNLDKENREHFPAEGPIGIASPIPFKPDRTTREIIDLVDTRFGRHPGLLAGFDWPVTPVEAEAALVDFIEHRLPWFGPYQDAMWTEEPWLFHSRLAAALNLKLLDPRRVIAAAEAAYHSGAAPLASVEGFIRQILGWREFVRGIYWTQMPAYLERNELGAAAPLPRFFWTGKTDMNCLHQTITQSLDFGYAHHIQRLMVTGLYCLLAGIDPKQVHEWYLAMYVDAVEWVELPNTLGMSQYADGGIMGSKPYVASGKYIDRMSNYCKGCQYKPDSCPITEMYWGFLDKHQDKLAKNPRMLMQIKNLKARNANSALQR
ncbi:MAG: cryptochrome/photolyase family protein [Bryobacterales bacterium]|nr:cryptochrome/photolyase family protein [Bryobacterales bacterium]